MNLLRGLAVVLILAPSSYGSDSNSRVADISIKVLDPQGAELGSLFISRWETAFDTFGDPKYTDFHFDDDSAFHVEVTDTSKANTEPSTPEQVISVTITSIDFEGQEIDKIVASFKELGDTGLFKPDPVAPFILTSFVNDDEFALAGNGDSTPSANNPKDRSLRVFDPAKTVESKTKEAKLEVGGKIVISTPGLGTPKEVPIWNPIKSFNVRAIVYRLAKGGAALASEAEVREAIARANQVWAQAGVRFVLQGVSIKDPPSGVSLQDGLDVNLSTNVSDEMKALLADASDNDDTTLDLVVVHELALPDPNKQGSYRPIPAKDFAGFSLAKPDFASASAGGKKIANTSIVVSLAIRSAAEHFNLFTLPHELGHLLLNTGDHEEKLLSISHGKGAAMEEIKIEFIEVQLSAEKGRSFIGAAGPYSHANSGVRSRCHHDAPPERNRWKEVHG